MKYIYNDRYKYQEEIIELCSIIIRKKKESKIELLHTDKAIRTDLAYKEHGLSLDPVNIQRVGIQNIIEIFLIVLQNQTKE